MRLDDTEQSDNIEDRRGESGGGFGGGGFGLPMGGGLGIGTIVVLGLIGWALGIDPRLLIGGAEMVTRHSPYEQQSPIQRRPSSKTSQPTDAEGKWVSQVLRQNEDRWKEIFEQSKQ